MSHLFVKPFHTIVPMGNEEEHKQLAWFNQESHGRPENPGNNTSCKKCQSEDYFWCGVIIMIFVVMFLYSMLSAHVMINSSKVVD